MPLHDDDLTCDLEMGLSLLGSPERFLFEGEVLALAGVGLRRALCVEVLLAWEAGELSEGQVCHLLATDPVTARLVRERIVAAALRRWERWRACNAPSPGSAR